jgi:hypothetical protein
MRVIQARLASADEFRAWITARRRDRWVDDAWVLPIEQRATEGPVELRGGVGGA